ncbi:MULTISPECIES: hypothetical protein [Gordonia]|uniref:hypothetical protein n=1 Tax=Gordonia TaxID=2053 RepID=UPI003399C0E2
MYPASRLALPPSSALLGLAALSFLLYPLLRGFGPEVGVAGARHLGSPSWVAAHVAAMIGFVALAIALRRGADDPRRRSTELLAWLATSLLLPYYGAETFALNDVGQWVTSGGDPAAMAVADDFRMSPVPLVTFVAGWVLLGWVAVRIVRDDGRAASPQRWGVRMTAIGLLLFLPQFFAPGPVRIAHGIILGLGLAIWAITEARRDDGVSAANSTVRPKPSTVRPITPTVHPETPTTQNFGADVRR